MSKTIDEKVVQMKFDNSHFEQNVSKSLKTLDTLKYKLKTMDFSRSASDLEGIGKAAKKIDMSGLSQGIETVHAKFSALQVIGVTALSNITNSAINAGKRIVSSLGDALINGGKRRALNIQNAKFQIEGLLGTEEFQKQWARIDESINWAVKDTAYGYDSAAKAASQFMASNIKVGEQMDYSLRAISGVAAMTNSTYDDIANVFTRVAGQGRVMAIDLNSLAARGMNAAATLGKALGKSEAEIRDMVSKGQISFEMFAKAMDDAFGEHAKKGNETFEGSLANMKAAMSRIGAKVWDPLLTNQKDVFNQMRLLINDLNNNYLDTPIKSLNAKLTSAFQNLTQFIEKGGLKNILLGIGNVLSYIGSVLKPIKEAFRDIFPKKSVDTLVEYTERFKNFTSTFKLSEKTANNLRNTFKGLFSLLSTGIHIITAVVNGIGRLLSNLTGIPGGILGVTGALGNWITKLATAIKESQIFNNVIQGVVSILEGATNKLKEFTKRFNVFDGLVNGIKKAFVIIGQVLKEFGKMLGTALRTGDLKAALDVFNTGVFSGILLNIKSITKSLQLFFGVVNKQSISKNLSLIISNLKDSLYALQFDIKADALMRIAKAIAILAAALFVLSLIRPERLASGLIGLGIAIAELMEALKYLDKFTQKSFKDLGKLMTVASVIKTLSNSLLILSIALKIMGSLDITQMGVALFGMAAGLVALCAAVRYISTIEKDTMQSAKVIRKLSTSLVILALALKIMGSMSITQMGVALLGMVVGLTAMVVAINKLPTYKKEDGKIASMIKMAFSLILLGVALKILASIGWPNVLVGLGAMGGALAILLGFVYLLPKDLKELNAKVNALNMMAMGLGFLGFILKDLGKMKLEQVGIALAAMGGALLEILLFLKLMPDNVNVAGFVGLAASLLLVATAMKILGSLGIPGLLISLGALAGAFIILGVAGKVLEPVIPVLIALAAAMGLFGAGIYLMGAGVLKFAAGIAALAAALTAGVTTIVAGIQGIILGIAQLVPELIKIFGESIVTLCQVIMKSAPMIAETVLVVVHETLKSLVEHGPEIVNLLFQFLIGILHQLRDHLPEFIVAAMEVIEAFMEGIVLGLKQIDPSKILPAVATVALLTGIFMALAALSHMIPQAMIGVLGFGVLVAELALVLAAIGALSKIPGLKEFIADGGNFLQIVGTAIGQFVGGIAGGIAKGFSSSMPEIATNLSEFMKNLEPFIAGARLIDGSVLAGVSMLALAIMEITAVNLYANIAKFLTLGSSFATLGTELSDFMNNAKDFITGSQQIKPEAMKGVSILADTIVKLTAAGFLDSITKWITGSGSLSTFSVELVAFGKGLKEFSNTIQGLNASAIIQASKAADGLVELSNKLPNRGGLSQFFGGKKSLKIFGGELEAFGKGLKEFSDAIVGLNVENMNVAIDGADKLIDLSNKVPSRAGMGNWFAGKKSLKLFGGELEAFADGLKDFSDKVAGLNVKDMYTATNAADVLVDLTNKLPNRAGMGNWFAGKKSLKLFGGELEAFGNGIKSFAESVKDINVDSMNKALSGADKLVDLTNKVPNRAGMGNWFGGKKSLEIFGGELKAFGNGIKDFCESIKDSNTGSIAKAAEGADKLVDLSNKVPNRAGMANWFGGKKSLEIFGGELKAFGKGLKEFCDETKDIKMNNMTDVLKAVETLAKATGELPDINGKKLENRAWGFGYGIWHIAEGLSGFCEKLNGTNFNVETITNAVNAVKTLSEVFDNLPDKDGGKIENRGWGLGTAIDHFANGISSFINKLNGTNLDPDYISKVANSIKTMAEAINTLPDKDGGKIENRAWGLGCAIGHFANGFSYLMTKLNESNYDKDKIDGAAESIKTMAEAVNTLPDKDGGKIENRAWGLGEAFKHFGNGLNSMISNLGENFDAEKMKSAADVVKVFSEAVQNLPDKDGGKIENRAWGLGCAIGHFGNGLKSMANGLNESNFDAEKMRAAADVVRTFGYAVNDLPDKDGGKIENRAWGLGCAIGHFGNGLESLSNSLNESNFNAEQAISAASVVRTFGEIFNSLPDKDGGTIENRAWGLGYGMTHFGNGLKDFCAGIANSVFDKVPTAIDYIKQFSEIVPVIPENAETRLAGFGAGISDLGSKFGSFLESVNKLDFSNTDKSFENIKKLLESLDSVSNFNVKNISAVGEAIKTVGEALNNLANIPNDISTKFNDALSTLGQNGMTSFLNAFSTIESDMNGKGLDAITGFTSGINNNQSTATDALVNLHNACKEKIKTDEYETIGKNVVEGFARGISNNTKLATDAMSIMTAKVEAQARQDLDINSPSKLFRKIGSGVPEGFAQGISMFKDSIKKSVTNMSNSAIDSTRNVIAKISNIINSDADNTMTLRPILDLTDVENGVQKIGSLFGGPSLAVASNLGSISYGMNRYNQNGGEDIVSAIDKLGKSLGNTNGDTYNINGITYDDGSEISEAVKTLVRAARIERRT